MVQLKEFVNGREYVRCLATTHRFIKPTKTTWVEK